jgi:hypothetical protein
VCDLGGQFRVRGDGLGVNFEKQVDERLNELEVALERGETMMDE